MLKDLLVCHRGHILQPRCISSILTTEQLIDLICSLLRFYIKRRTRNIMRYSNLHKIVNDWLTNLNECWRMIDKTFICHNFWNMLKFIPRTRIIATDTNVHKRIHTNSTTMYDEFNSGPIRKYTQVFVGGCLFIWLLAKTLLFILTNQCRISRKKEMRVLVSSTHAYVNSQLWQCNYCGLKENW